MGLTLRVFGGLMKGTLATLFPPQCLACGAAVGDDGALCPACWREAEHVGPTACTRCGVPLPGGEGSGGDWSGMGAPWDDAPPPGIGPAGSAAPHPHDPAPAAAPPLLCDGCLAEDHPWDRGRAALVYRGTGRALVLALKHGDRPDLAPHLGRWLAQAAAPVVRPGMVVVPVPLHPRRLLRRKYNQAALLAAHVARAHGLAHRPDALVRTRHTPMQDHRGASERFANVAGALGVPAGRRGLVAGRDMLVIDDVMASGATLGAAARALAEAGAASVSVAVLARSVRETPPRPGNEPE